MLGRFLSFSVWLKFVADNHEEQPPKSFNSKLGSWMADFFFVVKKSLRVCGPLFFFFPAHKDNCFDHVFSDCCLLSVPACHHAMFSMADHLGENPCEWKKKHTRTVLRWWLWLMLKVRKNCPVMNSISQGNPREVAWWRHWSPCGLALQTKLTCLAW